MKRMPSYTDRIVYKSLPGCESHLKVDSFVSAEDTLSSDHKPVIGSFTINTTGGSKDIAVFITKGRGILIITNIRLGAAARSYFTDAHQR